MTPVLVVDLDGTLVRGNTLHIALKVLLMHGSLWTRMKVAWLGALRRLKVVSHEYMKYEALPMLIGDKKLTREFVAQVKALINEAVADVIVSYRKQGATILLATAAASQYVPLIWDEPYVASPDGGPDLRGNAKVSAVAEWMKTNGAFMVGFITDHVSDLPMAQYAASLGAAVYLVEPDAKTAEAFEPIPVRIVRASASPSRPDCF